MSDIFLSYASEDRERVRPLVERLEEHGWSVWWDRSIPPGQTWTQMIEDALDAAKAMVVVWSEAAVESEWVEIEATKGKRLGSLIPVKIDAVEAPLQFGLMQAADLISWDHSVADPQLQSVLRQLERTLGVPEPVDGSSGNESQAAFDAAPDLAAPRPPVVKASSSNRRKAVLHRRGHDTVAEVTATGGPWKRVAVTLGVVALLTSALATLGWLRLATAPAPLVHRLAIEMDGFEWVNVGDKILISPDGRRLAVSGSFGGTRGLYWRNMDEESFRLIPGTEWMLHPAFSPDGEWLVYTNPLNNELMRVSLAGGVPQRVGVRGNRPYWGDGDTIVFVQSDGVYRVPSDGGEPTPVLHNVDWADNLWLLPAGRGLLMTDVRTNSTVLLDFETDSIRELVPEGIDAMYVESGHLLWVDLSGGLWKRRFDPRRGQFVGEGSLVLDGLRVLSSWSYYSVSRTGTLVYTTQGEAPLARLLVVDMGGNVDAPPLSPRRFHEVRWSPDGRSIAYGVSNWGGVQTIDFFTYNVLLGTAPKQLTFGGDNRHLVWSPDGTRVAFTAYDDGWNIFVKSAIDDSPPRLLGAPTGYPSQWLDRRLILRRRSARGIWVHDVLSSDSTEALEYLATEGFPSDAQISSSGDLAAYVSRESGTCEVHVRSFPDVGPSTLVSEGGGAQPRWSPDGNTIYYWTPSGSATILMAARVERGTPLVVTSREAVLEGPYDSGNWDLHPDGDRIAITRLVSEPTPERHLVVVNWFEELRERMGGN